MRAPFAALLVSAALLACHSGPETRTGPMTITVSTGGIPEAGVSIVFHRPDGSVQEVATTDAAGRASAVVAGGSLVTVARQLIAASPTGGRPAYFLQTIAGVEPGDALVLGGSTLGVGGTPSGTATATFAGPVDGASRYQVDASCTAAFADAGYVASLSMGLYVESCGTTIDAIAQARAPDGALLAYATALDVPITGTVPDRLASIALGPWRTEFATVGVDVTNAPADAQLVSASLTPRRNGRSFLLSGTSGTSALTPGGSASLSVPYPTAFGSTAIARVALAFAIVPSPDEAWIEDEIPVAAPYAIDLAAKAPPRLSGAAVADVAGGLAASWQQARVDPALDATYLSVDWDGADLHWWQVVLPPNATSFAFPELPPELAIYASRAGAPATTVRVESIDLPDVAGYDAYRPAHLAQLWRGSASPRRYTATTASTPAP